MKFISFWFREGSSLLYAGYLAAFAMREDCLICLEGDSRSIFVFAVIGLFYLALQNAMAAFTLVGNDRPLMDFFLSLAPLFTLAVIAVLAVVETISLTQFEILCLTLAGLICLLDTIFNTQVVFKMNRLATDIVNMK